MGHIEPYFNWSTIWTALGALTVVATLYFIVISIIMASYRSSRKQGSMKDKVTVNLRRKASGEVIGEIVNDKGEIVASKHFGIMSEAEFRRAMKHIEKEFPDACVGDIIELIGN